MKICIFSSLVFVLLGFFCWAEHEGTDKSKIKKEAHKEKNSGTDDNLPSVLIIGDSISIGYTPFVISGLEGKADVQRVKTNCGHSKKGLDHLDRWLGDRKWDVVHFNFGLHDLCYRHPNSKVYGNRDKINGTIGVELGQYEKNLEQIVRKLQATKAKLIWASTTLVPEGEPGRKVGDDLKYNEVAAKVMKKFAVKINDLHAVTAAFDKDLFVKPGDVHYTKEGSKKLAVDVVKAVLEVLD